MTSPATEFWSLPALIEALGAEPVAALPSDAVAAGVSIDSRTVRAGELFIAIPGERFDGHDYVQAALDRGAIAAVVAAGRWPLAAGRGDETVAGSAHVPGTMDHPRARSKATPQRPAPSAQRLIPVPDTLAALQRLASRYRDRLADARCTVIAVGGSNGKTTCRHLIHTALSARLTGTQSPRSFNNHLGVPLTLLGAKPEHDFVVCEIGSNHPGEVAALASIARPDIAVITSIGREHLEFFGTLEAVEREERSLLDHMPPGSLILAPPFDPAELPAPPGNFPLLGEHNRLYAALALKVAEHLGVDRAASAEALAHVQGVPGRLQRLRLGDITVIHDAYNANPDSAHAALAVLKAEVARLRGKAEVGRLKAEGRKSEPTGAVHHDPFQPSAFSLQPFRSVAILGDMLELGDAGPAEHRALGEAAAKAADVVVCIGRLSLFTAAAAGTPHAFAAWSDDLPQHIAALLQPGDVVLLKASRGMALERLLPAIEAREGLGPRA